MSTRFGVLSAFFLLISLQTHAQTSPSHEAYDSIQKVRQVVNKLINNNTSPENILKGISLLDQALIYLDKTPVFELAEGNIYLKGRKHDIYFDLANIYSIVKQNDSAISALNKMFAEGSSDAYVENLQNDSEFLNIRSDPRLSIIVNKLESQGRLYKGTAFKTAYVENLPDNQKIAGLSLLWSQAKYNFVYFDHLEIDWNKIYLDYLTKILNTKTTAEYYKVLQSFYALLKDGHTNVYPPKELSKDFYSRPPIRTELIENKVFITAVYSNYLRKNGWQPGMEILNINTEPVFNYAEKYIAPFISSSTLQDKEVREFSYFLLCGPHDGSLELKLKDKQGNICIKTLFRNYDDVKYNSSSFEYKNFKGIGCLTINNFEDEDIVKQFDEIFKNLSKTKALIIDIRNNGGGNSNVGFNIISKLINEKVKTSASKILKYMSIPDEQVEWINEQPDNIEPDTMRYYSKPIILLTGPRTFSAAEDFAATFKYMKRGILIGEPTGGSTGQPVYFDLPGGGSARVCGKRDTYPDGTEFVGIGVIPDTIVKPTIKDLWNNYDAAKEKALTLLRNK